MSEFAARAMCVAVWALVLASVVTTGACTSPTSPTVRVPFSKVDLRVGTGADAESGQTLLVNYSGWLYDDTKADKKGKLFDSSPSDRPFVFKLGSAQVIEGWDTGITGMKVGGLRRLVIPSELAYAREGAGSIIPPNATLIFEIELLSVVGG